MYGDGFVTWQQGGDPIWTLKEAGMRPNNLTMVSQRPISNEPMVRFSFLHRPCDLFNMSRHLWLTILSPPSTVRHPQFRYESKFR